MFKPWEGDICGFCDVVSMIKARVVSVGKDHNDISRLLDHLGHLHPALLQLLRPNHGSLVPQEVGAI